VRQRSAEGGECWRGKPSPPWVVLSKITLMDSIDFQVFDREWTRLGREICQAVYTNPKVQKIKTALIKNRTLNTEEHSEFINICNETKYRLIYEKYGDEKSQGYKDFSKRWQAWFQQKGVQSQQERKQRSSVDHILFGSTPEPNTFLLHFEEEMLGSMKP